MVTYSTELAIKSINDLDEEYMSVVIGQSMVEVLKSEDLKEASLEDFNIALTIDDFISEQERMQLMQFAMQMASSGAITMSDYTKMLQCTTKSQLQSYFDYVEYKRNKEQQQMQEAQMMQAQAAAETQAQAGIQTTAMNNEAKLLDTAMKQGIV